MVVAVSTFEASPGGDRCAQFAMAAFDGMGADDVLLTIHELPPEFALGPRPDSFRETARFWEGGDFLECLHTGPAGLRGGQFRYSDAGRTFDAILAIGEDVAEADEDAAWAMLNSFIPAVLGPGN